MLSERPSQGPAPSVTEQRSSLLPASLARQPHLAPGRSHSSLFAFPGHLSPRSRVMERCLMWKWLLWGAGRINLSLRRHVSFWLRGRDEEASAGVGGRRCPVGVARACGERIWQCHGYQLRSWSPGRCGELPSHLEAQHALNVSWNPCHSAIQVCQKPWPHPGVSAPWRMGVGEISAPGAWVPAWLSAAEAGQKLGDICTGPWPRFEARGECSHQDKSVFLLWKWKSLSCVWLFATPWTIQSTEFSRPAYWSG